MHLSGYPFCPFHIPILAESQLNGGTNIGYGPAGFSFFQDTSCCSQCLHTYVAHGPVRTLFLSLIFFLVPSYTKLYWLSSN